VDTLDGQPRVSGKNVGGAAYIDDLAGRVDDYRGVANGLRVAYDRGVGMYGAHLRT